MYSSSVLRPSIQLVAAKILITLVAFNIQIGQKSPRAETIIRSPLKTHSLLLSSPPATNTVRPIELPEFIEPVGNQSVLVGQDVQIACKINRLGSFKTAWLRVDDKGILTIHNNVITRNYRIGLQINNDEDDDGSKRFVLTIKNVKPSDKGGYMCQINSVPMRHSIGYLEVLTPPLFEEENNTGSESIVVNEGSSVNLSCKVSGNPAPLISWRREDNEPIRLSNKHQDQMNQVNRASLVMTHVSRLNSGAYLCEATNGVEPPASKRKILNVQYKPVIRLPQTEVRTKLAEPEARLVCLVDLNPLGSYHWVKLEPPNEEKGGIFWFPSRTLGEDDQTLIERKDLVDSDKYEISTKQVNSETVQMILIVRQIEKSDLVEYKCIARNSLGIQSSSVRLDELDASSDDVVTTSQLGDFLSTQASSGASWDHQSASSKVSTAESSSAYSLKLCSAPLAFTEQSVHSILVTSVALIVVVFVERIFAR